MLTCGLSRHSQRCGPRFSKEHLHGSPLHIAVGVPSVPHRCVRPVPLYQCRAVEFAQVSHGIRRESKLLLSRSLKHFGPPFEAVSPGRRRLSRHRRQISVQSGGVDALVPLGLDFLTFLCATVLVIPVFKSVGASPVLGFLFSGLVLGQLGSVP